MTLRNLFAGRRLSLEASHLRFGSVLVPYGVEPQHFLLCGATGTGKTQAIEQATSTIANRPKDRMVVLDSDGNLLSKVGNDTDIIANPFDARAPAWSPAHEIENETDIPRVVEALLPKAAENSPMEEWNSYARPLPEAIFSILPGIAPSALYNWLFVRPKEELATLVSGTPARRIFERGAEKMVASVLAILSSRLGYLRYLRDPEPGETPFTFTRWARQAPRGSKLFLTYKVKQRPALFALYSAALALLSGELLSQPPVPQPTSPETYRRTWLLADEWGLLGRVSGIEDVLTNGRRFGIAAILGIQDIHQLYATYGQHTTSSVLNSIGSWLILGQNDGESAEYFSRTLGNQQVIRTLTNASVNFGRQGRTRSSSTFQQVQTERLVLSGELLNLPNLSGFVRLRSDQFLHSVTITPMQWTKPTGTAPFIPRVNLPPAPPPAADRVTGDANAVQLDL